MIDRSHPLPLSCQVEPVGISRGAVYHHPQPVSEADQRLMQRIDAVHLLHPFAGSRMLRDLLNREGIEIGRRHIATLMRRMGIEALYRKPNTSKKRPGHTVYPCLLHGLEIKRANHVWATDISSIPPPADSTFPSQFGVQASGATSVLQLLESSAAQRAELVGK